MLLIVIVNPTTSNTTIEELRILDHGLSEVLVSDNGAVFSSNRSFEFTKSNSILRIRTTPYHLVLNGQVERVVQIFKDSGDTLQTRVSSSCFIINTPYTTTVFPRRSC